MHALARTPRATLLGATAVLTAGALAVAFLQGGEDENGDVVGWLIMSALSIAVAAVFLLRVVPNAERAGTAERTSATLGLVAFVSLIVFWTGLPFALGVPAAVLGASALERHPHGARRGEATAALVLAAAAIALGLVLCVVG